MTCEFTSLAQHLRNKGEGLTGEAEADNKLQLAGVSLAHGLVHLLGDEGHDEEAATLVQLAVADKQLAASVIGAMAAVLARKMILEEAARDIMDGLSEENLATIREQVSEQAARLNG